MDPHGVALLVVIIQTIRIQYFERIVFATGNIRLRKEYQENAINSPKINSLDDRKHQYSH
jgi:hypothetical protein